MQVYQIPIDAGNKETTKPGTDEFPLAVYHTVLSRNILGYVPLHWNEEIQFCLVTKGNVLFTINGEKQLLAQGEGIFINSSRLHMARPVKDPDSTYICLDIGIPLFQGFPGSVMEQKYLLPSLKDTTLDWQPFFPDKAWEKQVLDHIFAVYELTEQKHYGYELLCMSHIYALFGLLLAHRPPKAASGKGGQGSIAVQNIITYLQQNYGEKITLKTLAAHTSYTESECCRLFKRYTGTSIFTYLQNLRLEQSVPLLQNTDKPVSDVAYECGFSSTSYYIQRFRDHFGQTPLQYRKAIDKAKSKE